MPADRYYIADQEISLTAAAEQQKLTQRLRQYLELRNVSILIGNGCSIPLGSPVLNNAKALQPQFQNPPYQLNDPNGQDEAISLLNLLLPTENPPITLEALLGIVSNIITNAQTLPTGTTTTINGQVVTEAQARSVDNLLKKWVYQRCHQLRVPTPEALIHHRELLRRVLLRSTKLPRCKIFTTNYDLIIEYALDSLGIMYFDGFGGSIQRTLHPESYHYDLYYPGETTEGHVSRVDRVLHFYKLHGSINWRRQATASSLDVTINHNEPADPDYGNLMIYPSPLKNTEMHGYPYAEMLRHFSAHINQSQSVLFTIGYAFMDDHINRLIYQALNVPSFVLVIVIPEFGTPPANTRPGPTHEISRLIHHVKSNRIIVITGGVKIDDTYRTGAGTIQGFASTIVPDISELDIQARVREEAQRATNSDEEEQRAE
jgi:hypothetical protein